ncbi:MAG: uroporphyrinogen decarboxylase family protein [Victivallales bacterium]
MHLSQTRQLWEDCRHYRPIPHLPLIVSCGVPGWPQYTMDEIQTDMEKMLVSELAHVYAACLVKDDSLPSIRANYGTGILPSLFGCEIMRFDHGALPAALPLHDTERIKSLVAKGLPDLHGGLGGRVFDTVAFYVEALKPYPKLKEWIAIDLADTQGPLDAAEIIWGSEIFLEMYDEPELVHGFLSLVTETIAAFTRAHQVIDGIEFTTPANPIGRVCVREDASVMVSGEMYDTFCKPYAQRLLEEFGGCIHWCGDGKAWWRSLITLRKLNAVNPYQGQFYDPVEMHRLCRDAGVMIWQWTTGLTADQREQIRTGFTLYQGAKDLDAAKRDYSQWRHSP